MKQAYFKYILALLLFGSNGVIASFIGLSSYEIVLLRSLLGSVLLIAIFFLTGYRPTALRYKKDLCFIALSGVAMGAEWLLLFEAYTQIGVGMSTLINYCGPAIVMVLSPLLFKERINPQKLAALIATLIGLFLISGQVAADGTRLLGIAYAVLSAISYAAMVIADKKSKKIVGLENATIQLFCAFITVAVFVGIKQGFYIEIVARDWLPVLWIGFVNTGLCCYLFFSSIVQLPAQTVSICGYLEPLTAVLFSALILKEALQPIQILGAVFIIGSAVFSEIQTLLQKKKPCLIIHHKN